MCASERRVRARSYFQVSVHDALAVQIGERFDHARAVEANFRFFECTSIAQHGPEFAAETTLEQHVQILAVFKRLV